MLYPVLSSNNWLSNAFDDFFNSDWMPRMNGTAPAVNVKETDKEYEMEIAAPGLKKEHCKVSLDNDGNLTIKLEKKSENKEDNGKESKHEHYLRREFAYADYEQSYTLPDNVDKDHISAKVENGVLTVHMPKFVEQPEQKNERTIEIG